MTGAAHDAAPSLARHARMRSRRPRLGLLLDGNAEMCRPRRRWFRRAWSVLSALRCQRPTQAGRTPLRHVGRCSISIMSKFFLPGSLANAARHFLCQAPAQSD